MHKEVLTPEQIALLPLIRVFMDNNFGLVGGTAIALQIGHRRSIDFDLFSLKEFGNRRIKNLVTKHGWHIEKTFKDELGQFTFFINKVQITCFHYPFVINFSKNFEGLKLPDLLTLAAMKAYALGGRAKWKDYVVLFFIIKKHHGVDEIAKTAKKFFDGEFNERIFREQLSYFKDISYAEQIEFMPGFEVEDETIRKKLTEFSLENI